MNNLPRLTIAGVRGGSGKTTLTLSLIAAFRRKKGLKVVPFKKGPDYIDAGWMSVAAGSPCYNLDTFLVPRERIIPSFAGHFSGDIAVIEGNRGLYDGVDADGSYSTAELAKLLKSSVVLILDCTKMTRTTAAVVLGCMDLDRDVKIGGVVLNQVSGSRHESVVRAAVEKYCSLPVLGAFPRLKSGELPERHMGLTPCHEHPDTGKAIVLFEEMAGKYLDVEKLFELASSAPPIEIPKDTHLQAKPSSAVRIGIIKDSAFQFYYQENLEALEACGAELIPINAISDTGLPDIDGLYIGGGFPETNAIKLAANESFRGAIRDAAEKGLPIYAECGGLMFLGESIEVGGGAYPMTGVLPVKFAMNKRPQAHGYTVVEVDAVNPFYPLGTVLNGHEFHYSSVVALQEKEGFSTAFKMRRGHGIMEGKDGLCYKNVFATYTHIHAHGAPQWAEGLAAKAREFKEKG
ncbi:MAG: hydrogenobyrinic acid a,c-diamide synthase (glutamine-hydrolyzing) [Nitrospirae bacterium]|nr:MAG: hydrogenobyrinic acid a,c-diamide synthase (glutamine-hydrolyzing) [Nitrospirota bacterium]